MCVCACVCVCVCVCVAPATTPTPVAAPYHQAAKAKDAAPKAEYRGCYVSEAAFSADKKYSGHSTGAVFSQATYFAAAEGKRYLAVARTGSDGHAFAFDGPLPTCVRGLPSNTLPLYCPCPCVPVAAAAAAPAAGVIPVIGVRVCWVAVCVGWLRVLGGCVRWVAACVGWLHTPASVCSTRPRCRPDEEDEGCHVPCTDDQSKSCGCADSLCPNPTAPGEEHNRRWAVYELKGKGGKAAGSTKATATKKKGSSSKK